MKEVNLIINRGLALSSIDGIVIDTNKAYAILARHLKLQRAIILIDASETLMYRLSIEGDELETMLKQGYKIQSF